MRKIATEKENSSRRQYAIAIGLGFQFAFLVIIMSVAGYWLDMRFESLPAMTIVGGILGSASGIFTVYKAVYPSKGDIAE